MTTRYYTGKAVATKQNQTRTITGSAIGATFTFTIGSVSVVVIGVSEDTTATAQLIARTLGNYDHPYFNAIRFSSSGAVVTLESKTAGIPFEYSVVAAVGGTTSSATVTAGTGPNYANDADNWSAATLPIANDTIVFSNNNIDVCWGLDLSGFTILDLSIDASYTGRIGLDSQRFATSKNARQMDSSVPEYRDVAFELSMLNGTVNIGEKTSPNDNGSDRIVLDISTAAPNMIQVWSTPRFSAEPERAAVRLITPATALVIYNATAGVGISADTPTDTASVLSSLLMVPSDPSSWIVIGDTSTVAGLIQRGGNVDIRNDATLIDIKLYDGNLKTSGTTAITEVFQYGGYYLPLQIVAGQEVDDYYYYGGTLDLSQRYSVFEPDDFYVGDLISDGQIIAPLGMFAFGTDIHFTGKINLINRSA